MIPNKTIIFFDEIQKCPNAATSLKSFKLDGRFDVICSGSLMGINYKEIESNSVGYKEDYDMKSMDFEEFLWAIGYNEEQIEDVFNHLINITPLSNSVFASLDRAFKDYIVIGGHLETDFFVRDKDYLIPVEVKENDNSTLSLNKLINNNKYVDIKYGVKLAHKNIGFNEKFYTIPYFLTFMLKRFLKEIRK